MSVSGSSDPLSADSSAHVSLLPEDETWLSTADLAARWKIPAKSLDSWASSGSGPRCARLGRHRRYRLGDVRAWEQVRLAETSPNTFAAIAALTRPDDETWLTTVELGTRLQIPPKTLASWASAGSGPRYARIGRHRRYRLADIRAWEHQQLDALTRSRRTAR